MILNFISPRYKGEVFEQLKRAVDFNAEHKAPDDKHSVLRMKLPRLFTSETGSAVDQSNLMSSASLESFQTIINGPYSREFTQIMEVLLSGFGRVESQSHSMHITFSLDVTNAQCFCIECCNFD